MSTGLIIPTPPSVSPKASVTALATATTLTSAHFGVNLTNTGASATLEHQLPAAADIAGKVLRFSATAAQITRFQPASGEKVYYGGDGVADKYVQLAGVIGNFIELYSDGVDILVMHANGVVTKEG
ncbi:MAG: hypothetical protein JXA73_08765 [Acidobacteria bacterium]|nr:hypothetical protein [Acidobacteriota bacterium]